MGVNMARRPLKTSIHGSVPSFRSHSLAFHMDVNPFQDRLQHIIGSQPPLIRNGSTQQ